MAKKSTLRATLRATIIVAFCVLVLAALIWMMLSGWQIMTFREMMFVSMLSGSLIFPLISMLVKYHKGSRLASPRTMMWFSILWMMVSAAGISLSLWNGLGAVVETGISSARNALPLAVMMMFAATFASALMQLSATADSYIQELRQRDRQQMLRTHTA